MLKTIERKAETQNGINVCESCGKEFSCGANMENCWCFEVELKAETLEDLRKDFKKCLCEDCLRKK